MTEQAVSNGDIQVPGPTPHTIEEKLTAATADSQNGSLDRPSETAGSTADCSKSKAPTIPPDEASTFEPGENEAEEYSIFPRTTRTYLSYLLGFAMTLSTLTATIYFPLIPMLSDAFAVSIQDINLTVTVYAIVQAAAPGFFASLADTTGRRPVLLGLVALYTAASLGLALNRDNYTVLIALRAAQSIGGSPIPAIGYGVAADVSPTAERGSMLGPMLSFCNGLSAVGPVVAGAVANSTGGYAWVFLALLIVSVLSLVLVGFTLPETARGVVGNGSKAAKGIGRTWWWSYFLSMAKGEKRGDVEGQAALPCPAADEREQPRWKPLSVLASLRIMLHPDAAVVLWTVASSYCVYYTFQVAIPTIFDEIYGYNDLFIGLAFLPGLTGMTVGGVIAGKLVDYNYARTADTHNSDPVPNLDGRGSQLGNFPIEAARYRRCEPFLLVQSLLIVGYGWAVHFGVHPAVPLVLQFLCCALSTLLSHTASTLLVDIFPDNSSSAYASGQIARCGLSAASAAALQPLVDAIGRGWYFTVFSLFIGLSGLCSVWLSRWKGMHWRQRR
ncbi:major facilitator superfamily domain-containing protein [Lasiosphaeris hirsuta]|uniref:Major facilitator superfamily domain-containing protein n=1 Tax=Lasiosphaeris hirsuta TaxID=260670 RepID=A0AA40B1L3_9PEZI|nr:major facilitator superfamily domain-containing protein [Lasiosphaeris hirsuta]